MSGKLEVMNATEFFTDGGSFLADAANLVCRRLVVQKKEAFMGKTFRKEVL